MVKKDLFFFKVFCIIFWIEACMGFIMEEFVPFMGFAVPTFRLIGDFVIMILGIYVMRNRAQFAFFLSFCVLAVLSTIIINRLGFLHLFNGARMFFGLLFVIPLCSYFRTCDDAEEIRKSFNRQMYVFLWIQAVCITWQFIRYGANDHGGGSFGFGYSGIVSTLICLVSFYLVIQDWDADNYVQSLMRNRVYIFLLYPILLNETKISFVLVAFYFILLFKMEFKTMVKLVTAAPFLALVVGIMYFGYTSATGGTSNPLSLEEMKTYLDGGEETEELIERVQLVNDGVLLDEDFGYGDMPRMLKHALVIPIISENTVSLILGKGLGHFKGGTMVTYTAFYKQHEWLLQGTVTMFMFTFVQLGIMGLIWTVLIMLNSLHLRDNGPGKAFAMKLMGLLVMCFSFFYNDFFSSTMVCSVFFFIIESCRSKAKEVEQSER